MKQLLAALMLLLLVSCDKKPEQKEIDVTWTPPEIVEPGIKYKLYYRTSDNEFSDSSVIVTPDTLVTLMFEVTDPTTLYFKVVAVDTVGNHGLPVYQEVTL